MIKATMKTSDTSSKEETEKRHVDPMTEEPQFHPKETTLGAAAGGAAGGLLGLLAGPLGGVAGLAAGASIAGYLGNLLGEKFHPTDEEEFWRYEYEKRPYYRPDRPYEMYGPAYSMGYLGFGHFYETGKSFDQIVPQMRDFYEQRAPNDSLAWEEARPAVRDAYDRACQLHEQEKGRK